MKSVVFDSAMFSGVLAWQAVELAFDWSGPRASMMNMTAVCRAAGLEPKQGDTVSVGRYLRRRGDIEFMRSHGARLALMPALRVAKS